MLINTLNHSVYQRFVMILLINTLFLTVDQHYYHRLLINSVGVSVDQRIVFERRNTCVRMSVTNYAKPPKTAQNGPKTLWLHTDPLRTHLFARPGLLSFFQGIVSASSSPFL